VERSFDDPGLVITTYEGTHIHVSPGTAGSSTSSSNINFSSRDNNVYAAGSEDYRIPSSQQINFSGAAAASTLAPAAAQNNNNNNNIYDLAVQIREQILGPAPPHHHHPHHPPLRPPPPPPQAHPPSSSNIHISQTSSDHLLRELQEAMFWGPRANTGSNSGVITGGQQASQDRRNHPMASSSHPGIFTDSSHEDDLLEDMLRPSSNDDLQDPTQSYSQFHHHFRNKLEQD
jgi:hypothetical protein